MEFSPSGNNLLDVINWLMTGYFVCLHNAYHTGKVYYSNKTLETIPDNKEIVYIDLKNCPELLNNDEWPWYIKDAGFVKYISIKVLPKIEHHFEIP